MGNVACLQCHNKKLYKRHQCYIIMTFVKFVRSHKLQNTLSTHVHFGFRQRFSTSEDGRNMTSKCGINY